MVDGLDLGNVFQNATQALNTAGSRIEDQMKNITNADGTVDQEQLLNLQFAMGQYNAMLETTSAVTKSIQDMLKTLAQRTG